MDAKDLDTIIKTAHKEFPDQFTLVVTTARGEPVEGAYVMHHGDLLRLDIDGTIGPVFFDIRHIASIYVKGQ